MNKLKRSKLIPKTLDKPKNPEGDLVIRTMALPADTNPNGDIFGGWLSALSTLAPATAAGVVMGTVPYMAPEQLEGRDNDPRADLFAFGCVRYEMLTGRRAFAGDTQASVISAIMSSEPPPISTLQPVTPPALERLVKACLAKDPDARRQHAADVAEELRGISQDSVTPAPARLTHAARRRGWRLAAAVAIIAVVCASAAWIAVDRLWSRAPAPVHFALTMPEPTVFDRGAATQVLAASADGGGGVYMGLEGLHGQLYWTGCQRVRSVAAARHGTGSKPLPLARWALARVLPGREDPEAGVASRARGRGQPSY